MGYFCKKRAPILWCKPLHASLPHSTFSVWQYSPSCYRPRPPPCCPGAPVPSAPPCWEKWSPRILGAFSARTVQNTCMHSHQRNPARRRQSERKPLTPSSSFSCCPEQLLKITEWPVKTREIRRLGSAPKRPPGLLLLLLFPGKKRAAGRSECQMLPLHPRRGESHLQPLLKADREAPPSSAAAARSRVRRIQEGEMLQQIYGGPTAPQWNKMLKKRKKKRKRLNVSKGKTMSSHKKRIAGMH